MKLIVTQINQRGGFIAQCLEEQYVVLRLNNGASVAERDVLQGDLANDRKRPFILTNVTQSTTLQVSLENWYCPEFVAQIILKYVKSQPAIS